MQSPDKPCRGIQNVPVPYYRSATASLHNLEQVICQHCPFISSAERINYPEADVRQYVKSGIQNWLQQGKYHVITRG